MSICKYCNSEINWIERRPHNLDNTPHTFDVCAAIRKASKASKAKAKRDSKKANKERIFLSAQAKAPIGSFIVTDCKNGFSVEWPIGKVVGHSKFRSSVWCEPLLVEEYMVYPDQEGPSEMWPAIVVNEARYAAAIERRENAKAWQAENPNYRPSEKVINLKALPEMAAK